MRRDGKALSTSGDELKHQVFNDVVLISGCNDSPDTHKAKWFSKVWDDFTNLMETYYGMGCDPFARNCQLATFTNDLDENTMADENKPAIEFLQQFETDSMDYVIFDPPFSQRQSDDHYDGIGNNLYASDGKMISDCLDEAARIIKPHGYLLKFGYNCNTFHHNMVLVKLWIIQKVHRTHNNSTIVSLWVNKQRSLNEY
jgi:hypothetical protein